MGWLFLGHALLLFLSGSPLPPAPAEGAALRGHTPPTNLAGEATSSSSILWTWQDPLSSSTNTYDLHDAITDAPRLSGLPTTSVSETGLEENTRYDRHVHANRTTGTSDASNPAFRYTWVHDPTEADFSLEVLSEHDIRITVVPPRNPNELQTGVEISDNNGNVLYPFSQTYTVVHGGLEPDTQYCFRIRFRNAEEVVTQQSYEQCIRTPPDETCVTDVHIPQRTTWLPEGDKGGDEMKAGNVVAVEVLWTGHGEPRVLHVTLHPSRIKGQSTNSGDQTHEDFALEAFRNPSWEIEGPDLVYDGEQTLQMKTKAPIAPGVPVTVWVTAWDWRGTFTIDGFAEGCEPDTDDAPADFDGDRLPDAFENQAFYRHQVTGQRMLYQWGSAVSPGTVGPNDGADDSDYHEPVSGEEGAHEARGDGLSAWEEYGAFLVQGEVNRTIGLQDDRSGTVSGTDLKDLFVYDPTQNTSTKMLQPGSNGYLKDFKITWHLIRANEMTNEGELKAGKIDKNGDANQRVVRLVRNDNLKFEGRELLGDAHDFSVQGGVPIDINVAYCLNLADRLGMHARPQEVLDFVVAHEIGHKLSLRHNTGSRTLVNALPEAPDNVSFAKPSAKKLHFWVPVYISPAKKAVSLEFPEPFAAEDTVQAQDLSQQPKGQITVHDPLAVPLHQARTWLVLFKGAAPALNAIGVQAHLRNLMDPVPNPDELDAIRGDPLTKPQEEKVNVKS